MAADKLKYTNLPQMLYINKGEEFFYLMDYKKKSLKELNSNKTYEEIDSRLASGWYVDSVGSQKKKKYKTKEVSFRISKKRT